MRLSAFRIQNFKSIVDTGECRLSRTDNILVLAGQNEAGKSAGIESLDFFGNGPSDDFDRLHRRRDEHPLVICRFLLETEDIEVVLNETGNQKLKKYLTDNPEVSFVRGSVNADSFEEMYFDEDTRTKLSAYFPETLLEAKDAPQPDEAVVQPAFGVKTLSELENLIFQRTRDFVFFRTFDSLLPGVVPVSELAKHPAVVDFQKIFKTDFAEIVKRDARAIAREELRLSKEASDNLNTYWTQRIEDGGAYNFTVKIVKNDPVDKSTVEFKIDRNDGDPLFMDQKSQGFRWFSAFNLRLRALGVEKEKIKRLVILIDEPGQGLHEKAQRDVKKVIDELGEKGAQVIYTTHHPNLIGTEGAEFARIRVISNTRLEGTKIETVAQFASRTDGGSNDTLRPLITAMGINSVSAVLEAGRKNVVVEGITDHYYLYAFRKLLGKSNKLFFLPACGVSNVPNLVSVLLGWGYTFKAVFDEDPGAGRKAYNLLKKEFYENNDIKTQEHVYKLPGCNGIEDIFSPNDFHQFVLGQPFPTNVVDSNSKLAEGKKEALARLFLEKVENDAASISLSKETLNKVEDVFKWLYEKFGL